MGIVFNPTGTLNVSWDSLDLPDGGLVRCTNLRVNQTGKLITRDGSAKINSTALNTAIWWIEEMAGSLYVFAGTDIYEDGSSIEDEVTSAQWSAIQYNAFNDTTKTIFALNGTDRKRVTSGAVNEWGLDAPTDAPTLGVGAGTGLTGEYNVRYTYVRKVGQAVVAESNPSDPAGDSIVLSNNSLSVGIGAPSDPQVTHARLYRTVSGGSLYYLDTEIAVSTSIAYGYSEDFEESDGYIAGTGFKFTVEDDTNGTENTYEWEELFLTHDSVEDTTVTDPINITFDRDRYGRWYLDPRHRYP
jgi:hypothetical protein